VSLAVGPSLAGGGVGARCSWCGSICPKRQDAALRVLLLARRQRAVLDIRIDRW